MTPPPSTRRWLALALLATTQFVLILDTAIVIVAIPSMEIDLGFTPEELPWVANAYILAFGGLLLLGGRLGDIVGRRRMFLGGLTLFALASLAGALATEPLWLILARAMQGVGAAAISPAALALVMTLFTETSERNKALGVWGSVAAAGAATGYIIGGLFTEAFGWQAVLWINVPIVALIVALTPWLLPPAAPATRGPVDVAGAVTLTGGITLAVYTLIDTRHAGWASARTLGLFALAATLLAAFVVLERRSSQPLIDLGIFRIASLRNGNILTLLLQGAMTPMFFFLTLYLQHVLDFSPIQAGLAQMPAALSFALLGTPVSKLISRIGYQLPAAAGGLIAGAGMIWLAQVEVGGDYFTDVMAPLTITAIGATLSVIALMIAATADAPMNSAGLASGLVNVTQQLGGAIGLAVLATVAASAGARSAGRGGDELTALTDGIGSALLVGAGFAVATGVLAAVLLRKTRAVAAPAEPRVSEEIAAH
ncbi:MFS transporter [Actinoplanes sp. NPDC049802]|uniref:MFS transporter n=1 Tax=Actinoplanes sp. NPDC049802 TaxID=3154742 RepID=UPI0033E82E98